MAQLFKENESRFSRNSLKQKRNSEHSRRSLLSGGPVYIADKDEKGQSYHRVFSAETFAEMVNNDYA